MSLSECGRIRLSRQSPSFQGLCAALPLRRRPLLPLSEPLALGRGQSVRQWDCVSCVSSLPSLLLPLLFVAILHRRLRLCPFGRWRPLRLFLRWSGRDFAGGRRMIHSTLKEKEPPLHSLSLLAAALGPPSSPVEVVVFDAAMESSSEAQRSLPLQRQSRLCLLRQTLRSQKAKGETALAGWQVGRMASWQVGWMAGLQMKHPCR